MIILVLGEMKIPVLGAYRGTLLRSIIVSQNDQAKTICEFDIMIRS